MESHDVDAAGNLCSKPLSKRPKILKLDFLRSKLEFVGNASAVFDLDRSDRDLAHCRATVGLSAGFCYKIDFLVERECPCSFATERQRRLSGKTSQRRLAADKIVKFICKFSGEKCCPVGCGL